MNAVKPQTAWWPILLCLFGLLQACSSLPKQPNVSAVFKDKVLLLAPGSSVNGQLHRSSVALQSLLKTGLQEQGYTVITLSDSTYQALDEQALAASGAIYNPGVGRFLPLNEQRYGEAFIQAWHSANAEGIAKQSLLLLEPALAIRPARLEKDDLEWDYYRLPVPQDAPARVRRFNAVSVSLKAYDHQGSRIWQGFQGAAIPFRWRRDIEPMGWYLVPDLATELAPALAPAVGRLLVAVKPGGSLN